MVPSLCCLSMVVSSYFSVFPDRFIHDYPCSVGPGSFLEVTKVLPLPLLIAASPDHLSFHVVAPTPKPEPPECSETFLIFGSIQLLVSLFEMKQTRYVSYSTSASAS